jgi:hypothetical protein
MMNTASIGYLADRESCQIGNKILPKQLVFLYNPGTGNTMPLSPQDFVSKWKRASARERQSVQEHFIDLCMMIGHETPMQQDPSGTRFAFEMGAAKTRGGTGWADVAKQGTG